MSNLSNTETDAGIAGRHAPDFGVTQWVDAAGQAIDGWGLDKMPGAYKLIFCFQDACPGCHLTGFPSFARVVDAFQGSSLVSFAVVQTVFEDFDSNTLERLLAAQRRYALLVPFGQDAGAGHAGAGSVLMQRYRNGGTPWFILIDPDGVVVYNHFNIDADKLIAFLNDAQVAEKSGQYTLTWPGVLQMVREGNPGPPRRIELTAAQWKERLTPEQYRITRLKGTEPANSSAMCALFEPGRYRCVCCDTELFDASSKFASKSGWPSFTEALAPGLVAYHDDSSHGMTRVETTCNVCDAHLGHVFPDGPAPSGLRYCINAMALVKRAS